MKRPSYIAAFALVAFLGPRWATAGDLPSTFVMQSGSGTAQVTVDQQSRSSRATEYTTDGSVANPASRCSYSASTASWTPVATATDVMTIAGGSTTTIKVTRIVISSTQTTAGVNSWRIIKRSSADSGGTSAAVTIVPHDSRSPGSTASVLRWLANPTVGTPVGEVWSGVVASPNAATAATGPLAVVIDFSSLYGQPITLRGTGQMLAVNFNGAAVPSGLVVNIVMTWTEE